MEEKEKQKQRAAEAAARHLQDDMTIGLGTGSTAYYLILEAGRMAKAGMRLKAVTTSKATEELARSHHISVILPEETDCVDLAIDGVDEIDREFRAVKGGGGALLREKIVASKAKEVIWIMDESKLVERLGAFPLAVEILPFGYAWTANAILDLGCAAKIRSQEGQQFHTDNGNQILDVTIPKELDYGRVAETIKGITGVLETGYFERACSRIIIGTSQGTEERVNPARKGSLLRIGGIINEE